MGAALPAPPGSKGSTVCPAYWRYPHPRAMSMPTRLPWGKQGCGLLQDGEEGPLLVAGAL